MSLLLLAASVVAAGQTFECTPVAVWAGDGPIWCEEGPRIRLSGIAAREMNGSCSPGHPCPDTDPVTARDALVSLVGEPIGRLRHGHVAVVGPTMTCLSVGGAGGDRTAAWCVSPKGGDLSCAMVSGGHAARWDRYWRDHVCR
jgi:endonuclease YncB( thermonuclease family)